MYRYDRSSKIFNKGSISQKFNKAYSIIKSTIENEIEDYLLNVNQTEYLNHIVNNYTFDIPIIQFENVCADSFEDDIPAEYFSHRFDVQLGQTYKKEIIQFIIPV